GHFVHKDITFFLAAAAARAKDLPVAERLYRRCLETDLGPALEAAVHDGLLRVLWEQRKYEAVVVLCERGLKQAAGAGRLLFHLNHARALVLLGKVDAGLAEADKAVAGALDEDARFIARITRLRLLVHAGQHARALAECQALLKGRLQPAQ